MSKGPRRRMSRRAFLITAGASLPAGLMGQALVEPHWLRTRHLHIGTGQAKHRILHFTDLHFRGDKPALRKLVKRINACSPDLICFTGDLIEDKEHVPGALEILSGINAPLFGVPGNHDFWADMPFDEIAQCFAATGGAWLMDEQKAAADGQIVITGASCRSQKTPLPEPIANARNICLLHYPAWVKHLQARYDLVLAGHSHGGQVRLPFAGAPILPFWVDDYERGLFETTAGPLYVNPGTGWFALPVRFNCRPEITVIEI